MLEYKLSNIAQAKGFRGSAGVHPPFIPIVLDYTPVTDFKTLIGVPGHEGDLTKIAIAEHERWCAEKRAMGWDYGDRHVGAKMLAAAEENDQVMRSTVAPRSEVTGVGSTGQFKDSDPMENGGLSANMTG